ncbi:unnamed protein product, partial [Musa acuminata subsp. burmannicoides]
FHSCLLFLPLHDVTFLLTSLISLTTAFFTQSKPSASHHSRFPSSTQHPPNPSPILPLSPSKVFPKSPFSPPILHRDRIFLPPNRSVRPPNPNSCLRQLIPRWRLFNPNAARPARALERSNLFDPKSPRSTSQIRFMSSSAAGKPPQGSSPAAISPDSPSPIQVVSTFASPFDELVDQEAA